MMVLLLSRKVLCSNSMNYSSHQNTLQAVQSTENWRFPCFSAFEDFDECRDFPVVEMTIPDDWRHQGLNGVFGFGKTDVVGAASEERERCLWKHAV